MKYTRPLMIGAALITLAAAAPASAQGVYVGAGPVGVGIGVDHDYGWRHRHYWRDDYASDCRVIRERIVTPRGHVIYKTRRICD